MATNGFKVKKSLNLDPQTGSTVTAAGDLAYNNATGKFEGYNGAADPIAQEAKAATLQNKTLDNTNTATLKDTLLTIQDDGDATKQAKFQASGITTGTTRTLTIPDADTTIVGTDATQTLSNKTLGNTNSLTVLDTNLTIQDDGDNTKQLKFQASGITTGNTRTLTAPDASTTIVGTDTTQTLTNKTISRASNTLSGYTANAVLIADAGGLATSEATLAVSRGGTNIASYTKGDLLVASASTVLNKQAVGTDGFVLTADSGQTTGVVWAAPASSTQVSASNELLNLGLDCSVAANALTIDLKQADGSTDPASGSGAVKVGMRDATSASGAYFERSATSAVSFTVSSGSTLGHGSGFDHYIWVYLLDNAGTLELAVSSSRFDDHSIQSTTAEGGAGGADMGGILYSTTARSNVAIRLIGRLLVNEATAGTWASAPSEVSLNSLDWIIGQDYVMLFSDNGQGGTNTEVRRYASVDSSVSRSMYFTQSASLGDSITIVATGLYECSFAHRFASNTTNYITANSTTATSVPFPAGGAIIFADALTQMTTSRTAFISAGVVIRSLSDVGTSDANGTAQHFTVRRIG